MNVKNKSCIYKLSLKQLSSAKSRNIIAIAAIALTTLLFTSLFTILMSINDGAQQNTFRQVGGDFHGTFKSVTESQMDELCRDPLIKEYGGRLFLGVASDEPFNKAQVEVSYMDDICAGHYFINLKKGRLPIEKNEIATDTHILSLLGIEPEIGAEVQFSFYIDSLTASPTLIERTYTLCGWWDADPVCPANFVNLSLSEAKELSAMSNDVENSMTGKWQLNVMFKSSAGIEENMQKILENHGYQDEGLAFGDNFIATGVNWAYTMASINIDFTTLIMVIVVAIIIFLTGYLIIYNIFQISVSNDIRFYGLLKTIGTTGRQLSKIIRIQAVVLSAIGIPIGLFIGWLAGVKLTPVIVSTLNDISVVASINPVIFIGSSIFALLTVLLSCMRPGKMAGKVSPVEAVRYTEGNTGRKKYRKGTLVSTTSMALANLGRNKSKTMVTLISLTLAVLLLNITVTFTNGFDMDKYLSNFVTADFVVGNANYFQVGNLWNEDYAVHENIIDMLKSQGGIKDGGRTFGKTFSASEFIEEDYYRQKNSRWNSAEVLDQYIALAEHDEDGRIVDGVQLYGMERFCLDKLNVLEGDISKLYEAGGRYVAAVYSVNEDGELNPQSHYAKLGDKITLRYTEYELYNPDTGEVFPINEDTMNNRELKIRVSEYRDVEYEVAALIDIPHQFTYRYYGADEFVMNDRTFLQDSKSDEGSIMYYAFDVTDADADAAMEEFLADYTNNINPDFGYESKTTYAENFYEFRNMFLMLGGVLSFIIGLVGILNFFNAILTGIMTRRREFAMLQSVGMTNRQLKQMLTMEGISYALSASLLSLVLSILLNPLTAGILENVFWFFSYHFTIWPVFVVMPTFIIIGMLLPLVVYKFTADKSIVERLRQTE